MTKKCFTALGIIGFLTLGVCGLLAIVHASVEREFEVLSLAGFSMLAIVTFAHKKALVAALGGLALMAAAVVLWENAVASHELAGWIGVLGLTLVILAAKVAFLNLIPSDTPPPD